MASSEEKYCLKWNNFESSISSAFKQLRDDEDFFDVTLVCEDHQVQAHKVILSACSPFFRFVLKKNPHQHPLLYLKGVKYEDITSILDFLYHGEVNVSQDSLNRFLTVAGDLKVKGLTEAGHDAHKTLHDDDKDTQPKAKEHITDSRQYVKPEPDEPTIVYDCEAEYDATSNIVEDEYETEAAGYECEQDFDEMTTQLNHERRIAVPQQGEMSCL